MEFNTGAAMIASAASSLWALWVMIQGPLRAWANQHPEKALALFIAAGMVAGIIGGQFPP